MLGLLIGHLIGDYLFQNDWMAKGKSKPGVRGAVICGIHSTIYAAIVATVMVLDGWRCGDAVSIRAAQGISSISWAWLVAFTIAHWSHYPIDRISLGAKWMSIFGQTKEGPFAPLVYVAVDNGLHLAIMYFLFKVTQA